MPMHCARVSSCARRDSAYRNDVGMRVEPSQERSFSLARQALFLLTVACDVLDCDVGAVAASVYHLAKRTLAEQLQCRHISLAHHTQRGLGLHAQEVSKSIAGGARLPFSCGRRQSCWLQSARQQQAQPRR